MHGNSVYSSPFDRCNVYFEPLNYIESIRTESKYLCKGIYNTDTDDILLIVDDEDDIDPGEELPFDQGLKGLFTGLKIHSLEDKGENMRSNFEFLNIYWSGLVELGRKAEKQLYYDNNACIVTIGIFAERLTEEIFNSEHLQSQQELNQFNKIEYLKEHKIISQWGVDRTSTSLPFGFLVCEKIQWKVDISRRIQNACKAGKYI